MKKPNFFLVTENNFHSSYLVSKWVKRFKDHSEFEGIIIRSERPSAGIQKKRDNFHKDYQEKNLDKYYIRILEEIYNDLSRTEESMARLFGIPQYSATSYKKTFFLGKNLNSPKAKLWLKKICKPKHPVYFFIFLDQILEPWWIKQANGRIINVHSAVLPYARGMFAIENLAAIGNIYNFKKSAGATVHHIDQGIDTGPIIKASRIKEPFQFESIWELKAFSFMMAFDLLADSASKILMGNKLIQKKIPEKQVKGPNFQSKDFTLKVQKAAEKNYQRMKKISE